MVAHEIEHQPHAAPMKRAPRGVKARPCADAPVRLVAVDGIGRARHLRRCPAGQRRVELPAVVIVSKEQRGARWAAFPNAHQPHQVKAGGGEFIPNGFRNVIEGDGPGKTARQIVQPDKGIHLVKARILSQRESRRHSVALGPDLEEEPRSTGAPGIAAPRQRACASSEPGQASSGPARRRRRSARQAPEPGGCGFRPPPRRKIPQSMGPSSWVTIDGSLINGSADAALSAPPAGWRTCSPSPEGAAAERRSMPRTCAAQFSSRMRSSSKWPPGSSDQPKWVR